MAARIRAFDWAATALGPAEGWPEALRVAVDMMLAARSIASVAVGPDRLLLYNDRAASLYGPNHPHALGRPLAGTFGRDFDQVAAFYDRVFAGEGVHVPAQPLDPADTGRDEIFEAHLVPVRIPDGTVIAASMTGFAIGGRLRAETALRESEARHAFLLRLGDAMRAEADADAVIAVATRLLGEALAPSRIVFVEIDDAAGLARTRHGWTAAGAQDHPAELRLADFGGALLADLRLGRTVRFDDVGRPPYAGPDLAALAAIGIRAGLSVPLIVCGRLVMNLNLHQHTPRHWTEGEVRLVEETAERLWAAVARARSEAALRVRESQFRALFESIDEAVILIEPAPRRADGLRDWLYAGMNERAQAMFGIAALVGRSVRDTFPDEDEGWYDIYDRVFRTGAAMRIEREASSRGMMLDMFVTAVATSAGARHLMMVIQDVTERRRMSDALHRAEERQAFLLRLSDALRPLYPPDAIRRTAATVLGRYLGASRVAFAADAGDGDTYLVLDNYVDGVADMQGRYRYADLGRDILSDLQAGRTRIQPDIGNDERLDDALRRGFADADIAASLNVPLVKAGRLVAFMGINYTAPHAFRPEEIDLVLEVAERTWAAVERAQAEAALRESEARLRQFGDASQDVLWTRDAQTLQWQYLTPAFETIYGLRRAQALAGDNYRDWLELVVPEDRLRATENIRLVRRGDQVAFEYRIRRPVDGALRWLRNTDFPIRNAAGEVVLIGGICHDLTDLRETELRLQALIEGIPQLVWRAGAPALWTWASPQWTSFTGQPVAESLGRGWLAALHPDDRAAADAAWDQAVESGRLDVEYRLRMGASGTYRWFQTRAAPVRNEAGLIVEWLGTSTDINDLRELQARQAVLVAELQHRTRNLIAVVRAVSDQTLAEALSLDDFRQRFGDRLSALSRVQGLLSHLSAGRRVTFDELLGSELTALGAPAEKVTLDGPAGVPLRSANVQTFSLALHELVTNAWKYGALAAAAGHLTVRWSVASDRGGPRLLMDWRETGVEMTQVGERPRGGGYGRELIERALPYQMDAETTYALTPDGVHCTIDVPTSASGQNG